MLILCAIYLLYPFLIFLSNCRALMIINLEHVRLFVARASYLFALRSVFVYRCLFDLYNLI